jgi:hypothetical protein
MLLGLVAAALSSSACPNATIVSIYEPQRGMRTPTVIDRKATPLGATRISLRCIEEPTADPIARLLESNEAREVCGRLAKSLQNAGASATIVTTAPGAEADPPYDLYVEWQVKQEHTAGSPWMGAASALTCTILPNVEQRTYRHRAVIRARDRSVLQTYESRARFLDYDGCGFWLLTWILDVFRDEERKVGGDHGRRRYSRDLYRQVTQSLANARARSDLLRLTPPRWSRPAPLPALAPTALPPPNPSIAAGVAPGAAAAPAGRPPTSSAPLPPSSSPTPPLPSSPPPATLPLPSPAPPATAPPATPPPTSTILPTTPVAAEPPAPAAPVDPSDGRR